MRLRETFLACGKTDGAKKPAKRKRRLIWGELQSSKHHQPVSSNLQLITPFASYRSVQLFGFFKSLRCTGTIRESHKGRVTLPKTVTMSSDLWSVCPQEWSLLAILDKLRRAFHSAAVLSFSSNELLADSYFIIVPYMRYASVHLLHAMTQSIQCHPYSPSASAIELPITEQLN